MLHKNGSPKKTENDAYEHLRQKLFNYKSKDLGLPPSPEEPFGAVMELGLSGSIVTFVALIDGTVSMYVRGGMSVIGAGTHEAAREAGFKFIAAAKDQAAAMAPTKTNPIPDEGRVRFYLLRDAGNLTWEMPMPKSPDEPLAPLFIVGNDLITQIRLASERFEANKSTEE